jgi:hypothetical protein
VLVAKLLQLEVANLVLLRVLLRVLRLIVVFAFDVVVLFRIAVFQVLAHHLLLVLAVVVAVLMQSVIVAMPWVFSVQPELALQLNLVVRHKLVQADPSLQVLVPELFRLVLDQNRFSPWFVWSLTDEVVATL